MSPVWRGARLLRAGSRAGRSAGWGLVVLAACRGQPPAPADGAAPPAPPIPSVPRIAAPVDGAAPAATLARAAVTPQPPAPSGSAYPPFRRTTMPLDELARLAAAAPELARVGPELAYFDAGDGAYIVRSSADHAGVIFTTQPLMWSPEAGQQVLVVAARGKAASFVAAWWVLPGGAYRLASSFVMLGEIAPVALAYRAGERALWWTSCWMCPGETGHVSVREDHHLVIVQD